MKRVFESRLLLYFAAFLGAITVTYLFFPGFMSKDSFEQFTEAQSFHFTDWHPPMMAFVWHFIDLIWPGQQGMLLFNNLLFWLGMAFILDSRSSRKELSLLFLFVIGFFPPVIALLSTIWKDVAMGSDLVLAVGLLSKASTVDECKTKRILLCMNFFVLLYAIGVRHNAITAVLPLCFWMSHITLKNAITSMKKKIVIGSLIFASLVLFNAIATKTLIDEPSYLPTQWFMAHDLTAISAMTGEKTVPKVFQNNKNMTYEDWISIYQPFRVEKIYNPKNPNRLKMTRNPQELKILFTAWLSALTRHPLLYLRHRIMLGAFQWGFAEEVWYPFQTGIQNNDMGISTELSSRTKITVMILYALRNSLLFRGWFYLLLLTATLFYILRYRKKNYAGIAVGASGIFYALSNFFFATAADFRLIWWTVIASLILVLLADE